MNLAPYILIGVALIYLTFAGINYVRNSGPSPARAAWLRIAVILGVIGIGLAIYQALDN